MASGMIVVDGIGPRLDLLAFGALGRAVSAMESGAERAESYAKSNAPWADQTGAARNGLNAHVYEEGGMIILELAHGVEHGYWLEVIQDGTFAIIMPTLEAVGPEVLREAGAGVVSLSGTLF